MDLLKTILIYMTMVFVSSVQAAPEPPPTPDVTLTPPPAISATATPSAPATPTPTPVPTPAITPNTAYKTVSTGDKGDRVREMQQRLAELGYYAGEMDGVFGNQTRRAVEAFQYNNGLSADGIAGRRTLTVLYEYADVVPAPVETTPAPTASSTPAPTEAPTFLPTPSPSPTPTATATPTASPTTAPLTLSAPTVLEEYYYVLAGDTAPLMRPAQAGVVSQALHPLQSGDTVLVPFLAILQDAGVTLLPASSDGTEQVAFALGGQVFRLTYTPNDAGEAQGLALYRDDQAQVLPSREAWLLDGLLYLPQQVTEKALGAVYTLDESLQCYAVALPADQ